MAAILEPVASDAMALHSNMLELGTPAPDFALPDVRSDEVIRRDDFDGQPLLVAFLCVHCPYVKRVEEGFVALATDAMTAGVGVVAISANDIETYPEDAPEHMATQADRLGFRFPYLYDESQDTAAAFRAACTPDFFLFDADHLLVYRGRMDSATPGNDDPVTGDELRAAVAAVANGDPVADEQIPSMGCGIKWKPGRTV